MPFTNVIITLAMAVTEPYKKLGSSGLIGTPSGLVFTEIPKTKEKSFSEVSGNVFLSCTFAIPAIGDKFKISPVIKKILILPADNAYALFYLAPF